MEFNVFETAVQDENAIIRRAGCDLANAQLFQAGLRILLPSIMRKKCPRLVAASGGSPELAGLLPVLSDLSSDVREAQSHERHLARQAVAAAASRFANREYAEMVFLWLTMQGYATQKEAVSQTPADRSDKGRFFP